jgi:hypothetical protein
MGEHPWEFAIGKILNHNLDYVGYIISKYAKLVFLRHLKTFCYINYLSSISIQIYKLVL